MLRQHHIGDTDAGGQAPGAGGEVDHRAVGPRHPLQAGQGAGVKTELGIVVILNNIPLPGALGRPVEQLGPAARRHGDACRELVAGGNVADRRPGPGKFFDGKAVFVHGQTAALHAIVLQHLFGAGVPGGLHGGFAGQQRGQQAQQVFQAGSHHDLLGRALHAPVFFQIIRQRLPQLPVALSIAVGQQLRRGVEQLLLEPRPGTEREERRVHAPGGKIIPDRRRGRCGLPGRRFRLHGLCRSARSTFRPGRQSQIFLYIKAAALLWLQIALRR